MKTDESTEKDPAANLGYQSKPLMQPIILGDITLASPNTQITVGAAGAGSALPATPTGYIQFNIGNNNFVFPYYAAS